MIGYKKVKLINASSVSKVFSAKPDKASRFAHLVRYHTGPGGCPTGPFAIKVMTAEYEYLFEREVSILCALHDISSAHFIELMDAVIVINPKISLVMYLELAACDLCTIIETHRALLATSKLMAHLAEGLDIMHNAGFIHGDIKPENVLFVCGANIDQELGSYARGEGMSRFVLADFDTCQRVGESLNKRIGTGGFKAPELCMGLDYTCSIDVWSLGILYFEIITGHALIQRQDGSSGSLSDSVSAGSSDSNSPARNLEDMSQIEFYFGKMPTGLQVSAEYYTGGTSCVCPTCRCTKVFAAGDESALRGDRYMGKSLADRLKKIPDAAQQESIIRWMAQMDGNGRPSADEVSLKFKQ